MRAEAAAKRTGMGQHSGRIALVTGAASGIGRCIAQQLACEDGALVCVVDRNLAGANAVVSEIEAVGGKARAFEVDLADLPKVVELLGCIDAQIGFPDIVINDAGVAITMPALEVGLREWELSFAVNVTSPFLITGHCMRAMRRRRWGRIVNVASISGVRAGTGRLAYGASKAALIAMTRQFAIESAEWGITVNAVAPGPVMTPLMRGLRGSEEVQTFAGIIPMQRYASVDEIAHAVRFLSADASSYITGETLAVDGGFLASGVFVRNLFES